MEDLINILLNNPFLLLLLLGGLFSMLRGKKDQNNEEEKPRSPYPHQQRTEQHQQRGKQPQTISDTIRKTMETLDQEVRKSEPIEEKPIQTLCVEAHRQEQLQSLSNRLMSDTDKDIQKISEQVSSPDNDMKSKEVNKKPHHFNKDLTTSLTRQGLMQSVIMAEVLGSPRARKPYQSVVMNRRNK